MLMILVSNRLTLANKTSYESRAWRAQNVGGAREPGAGASKRTKSAEIPFNRETGKRAALPQLTVLSFTISVSTQVYHQPVSKHSATLEDPTSIIWTTWEKDYALLRHTQITFEIQFKPGILMKARASANSTFQIRWQQPAYCILDFHERERERERVTNLLPAVKTKLYLR